MTVVVPLLLPPAPRLKVATVSVEPSIDCSVPAVPRLAGLPWPAPLPGPWAAVDADEEPPPLRALAPRTPPTTRTTSATAVTIHVRGDRVHPPPPWGADGCAARPP